jgi:hypothetical protein
MDFSWHNIKDDLRAVSAVIQNSKQANNNWLLYFFNTFIYIIQLVLTMSVLYDFELSIIENDVPNILEQIMSNFDMCFLFLRNSTKQEELTHKKYKFDDMLKIFKKSGSLGFSLRVKDPSVLIFEPQVHFSRNRFSIVFDDLEVKGGYSEQYKLLFEKIQSIFNEKKQAKFSADMQLIAKGKISFVIDAKKKEINLMEERN